MFGAMPLLSSQWQMMEKVARWRRTFHQNIWITKCFKRGISTMNSLENCMMETVAKLLASPQPSLHNLLGGFRTRTTTWSNGSQSSKFKLCRSTIPGGGHKVGPPISWHFSCKHFMTCIAYFLGRLHTWKISIDVFPHSDWKSKQLSLKNASLEDSCFLAPAAVDWSLHYTWDHGDLLQMIQFAPNFDSCYRHFWEGSIALVGIANNTYKPTKNPSNHHQSVLWLLWGFPPHVLKRTPIWSVFLETNEVTRCLSNSISSFLHFQMRLVGSFNHTAGVEEDFRGALGDSGWDTKESKEDHSLEFPLFVLCTKYFCWKKTLDTKTDWVRSCKVCTWK